jgi:hypothetical protein
MFQPNYRIPITVQSFPKDNGICLGTQLSSIVQFIKNYLPDHLWYAADVDAIGKHANIEAFKNYKPSLVGNDLQFIHYCSGIRQFIWGVFLCICNGIPSQEIENIELETEELPFRPIHCNGILLELRTFDTSYFEIYSEDQKIMNLLSEQFSVDIETVNA